jgi:hypothetical protein
MHAFAGETIQCSYLLNYGRNAAAVASWQCLCRMCCCKTLYVHWPIGALVTIEELQPGLMLLCAPVCSFMAGYHVHEKAILTYTLPLALDALKSRAAACNYVMLSVTGHYALLLLLFTRNEYPLKASDSPLCFHETVLHFSEHLHSSSIFKSECLNIWSFWIVVSQEKKGNRVWLRAG